MRNSKRISIVAGGTAILMGVGIAFAYWTSTGTGDGTASTGTSSAWQVDVQGAVGDDLSPDGPTQTVDFTVTNNNSGVQRLQDISVSVANDDGSEWTAVAGCSAADYLITQHAVPAGTDVAAAGTYDGQISIQMIDTHSNQDACKNAVVPLHFSAS